jgi:anthranilate/para-aminobenzoate synthase component I
MNNFSIRNRAAIKYQCSSSILDMHHIAEHFPGNDVLLKGNFTHEQSVDAVKKARDYIITGDIFEVNDAIC